MGFFLHFFLSLRREEGIPFRDGGTFSSYNGTLSILGFPHDTHCLQTRLPPSPYTARTHAHSGSASRHRLRAAQASIEAILWLLFPFCRAHISRAFNPSNLGCPSYSYRSLQSVVVIAFFFFFLWISRLANPAPYQLNSCFMATPPTGHLLSVSLFILSGFSLPFGNAGRS